MGKVRGYTGSRLVIMEAKGCVPHVWKMIPCFSPTAESFGVSAKRGPKALWGTLGQSSRKVLRGSEVPSKG